METVKDQFVDCAAAHFIRPGETVSGDRHLVCFNQNGVLIAVVDGIGHGEAAADAAKLAISIIKSAPDEPVISVVEQCHAGLRSTRGVVLSIAALDLTHSMMTWLGVGNVQGVLMRNAPKHANVREMLLLRGGVVGSLMPPLQAAVLPIARGDSLFFATDGIRTAFVESLSLRENPQRAAGRILDGYHNGHDDALILAVRLLGPQT